MNDNQGEAQGKGGPEPREDTGPKGGDGTRLDGSPRPRERETGEPRVNTESEGWTDDPGGDTGIAEAESGGGTELERRK